jgi:hypothetical protein
MKLNDNLSKPIKRDFFVEQLQQAMLNEGFTKKQLNGDFPWVFRYAPKAELQGAPLEWRAKFEYEYLTPIDKAEWQAFDKQKFAKPEDEEAARDELFQKARVEFWRPLLGKGTDEQHRVRLKYWEPLFHAWGCHRAAMLEGSKVKPLKKALDTFKAASIHYFIEWTKQLHLEKIVSPIVRSKNGKKASDASKVDIAEHKKHLLKWWKSNHEQFTGTGKGKGYEAASREALKTKQIDIAHRTIVGWLKTFEPALIKKKVLHSAS